MIDLTIHRQALDRNIQKARESGVVIPTFENMKHPETVPEPIRARLRGVGLWDVDPLNLFRITWKNEPMESGGLYQRRTQLHRAAPSPHRRARPHHRPGGQVVPHRLPQGGGLLRLSGSPAGHRTVRRRVSPGGVALHRQLLPGRRVQLQAAGGPVGGHPPGGHEPGAVRVALPDRRRGDRHPRLRVQRQGDLRQDPRAAAGARLHDLQPV